MNAFKLLYYILLTILLCSCNSEVLFDDNFGKTAVGSAPLAIQQIGTASISGDPGSVKIVASPLSLDGNWVQVNRANSQSNIPGIKCTLSKLVPAGEFTFTATLFIPANTGLVTISFNQNLEGPDILHLDFTQDNRIRIDDDNATKFGSFPRDKDFTVLVTLNTITRVARIRLDGIGAAGDTNYNIAPFTSDFNAVTFWVGYPWLGFFDVDGIIISHKTN